MQTRGEIVGSVTDKAGRPVPGATVSIVSGTTSFPEIAAESDTLGRFALPGVPEGQFEVEACCSGRERQCLTAAVPPGQAANVQFRLEPLHHQS